MTLLHKRLLEVRLVKACICRALHAALGGGRHTRTDSNFALCKATPPPPSTRALSAPTCVLGTSSCRLSAKTVLHSHGRRLQREVSNLLGCRELLA